MIKEIERYQLLCKSAKKYTRSDNKDKKVTEEVNVKVVENSYSKEEAKSLSVIEETSQQQSIEGYVPKSQKPTKSIMKSEHKKSGNLKVKFDVEMKDANEGDELKNDDEKGSKKSKDSDGSELSLNTSSDDEVSFDHLCDMLSANSYTKINMFFLSICDLNKLSEYSANRTSIQNSDPEKMGLFQRKLVKEVDQINLHPDNKSILKNEFETLLTYLNFQYEAIPTFSESEYRTIIYCFLQFIYNNSSAFHMIRTKPFKDLLTEINENDYNEILMDNFKI